MKMRYLSVMTGFVLLAGASFSLMGCESDLDKAKALAKAKQKTAAAKLFEKVLKVDKKSLGAFEGLGAMYCTDADYSGVMCLDVARRFVAVHAENKKAKAWLQRALYSNAFDLTTSGQLNKAESYLKQYLKMDPNNAKAHFISGLIKFRQGKKPPVDGDDLKIAIKRLEKAIKTSSPTDKIKLNPKDKVASPLQWESYIMQANVYEMLLIKEMSAFEKTKAGKAKGAKFKPNAKYFKAGLAAYLKAHSLNKTQTNKKRHFYPYFQVAMFYFNFKKDKKVALSWLLKAEKKFKNSRQIVSTIYQVYKQMAKSLGKGRRNRKKKRALNKKAKVYFDKYANMPKPKKK